MPWLWAKSSESRAAIFKCPLGAEENTAEDGAVDFKGKEVFLMPGFDGTGPMGAGPMTGGGQGFCNPASAGYGRGFGRGRGFRRGYGPGFGRGFGRGFGWRGFYPASGGAYEPAYGLSYGGPYGMSREDEVNMLKDEADAMREEFDAINRRIEDLESQSSES